MKLLAAVLLVVSHAVAAESATRVFSITSPVHPGGEVTLIVESTPRVACSGRRQGHFSDAFSIELPAKTTGDDGRTAWQWRVMNGHHPIGARGVHVTCTIGKREETVDATFSVIE